jgi:hypothetical protein
MANRWHRLCGERFPEWQCAGCREPIGGREALALGDGNRVHLDDVHGLDCLAAYGRRWRDREALALAAMGLQPPADDAKPCRLHRHQGSERMDDKPIPAGAPR